LADHAHRTLLQLGRVPLRGCLVLHDSILASKVWSLRDTQAASITREAHFDGKFLLRTSDESLGAADIALGYKALYEAERGWRDMKKSTINLRPVYHRREDRIRAHVQLCWLALLVLRVAEIEVDDTWRNIRNELDRMHLVTFTTTSGTVSQRSELTPAQRRIFASLKLPEPPRFYDFTPAPEPPGEAPGA
ncbi:MAG: IS1634 family transposase, partial [Acidimicrobiales bacterium]